LTKSTWGQSESEEPAARLAECWRARGAAGGRFHERQATPSPEGSEKSSVGKSASLLPLRRRTGPARPPSASDFHHDFAKTRSPESPERREIPARRWFAPKHCEQDLRRMSVLRRCDPTSILLRSTIRALVPTRATSRSPGSG